MAELTLAGYRPPKRYPPDDALFETARIEQAATEGGTATIIEGPFALAPPVTDPASPPTYAFTSSNATAGAWFRVVFIDADDAEAPSEWVQDTPAYVGYSSPSQVRMKLTGRPDLPEGSSAATLADDLLNEHIGDADRQIDAALNDRYQVPFDPVPALISDISADIAGWLATTAFRQASEIRDNDPVQKRYERAIALLAALNKGTSSLPEVTDGRDSTDGAGATLVNQYDGVMFPMEAFGLAASTSYPPTFYQRG